MKSSVLMPLLVFLALVPGLLYCTGNDSLGAALSLVNVLLIGTSLYWMMKSDLPSP